MKKYFIIAIVTLLFSCKSDEPKDDSATFEAVISTLSPINIKATTAIFRGEIISMENNNNNENQIFRGVCWSINSNPTINDLTEYADGSGLGVFELNVDDLEEDTTYHLRAFVSNGYNTYYGNDLIFTTPKSVSILNSKAINILPDSAVLYAEAISNTDDNTILRNICLSVNPNPSISDFTASAGYGEGEYTIQVYNLEPNTTYYAKAYSASVNGYIYGDEFSFKTTGYYGDSGGYVFFDKGEETDNWRYLEASPTPINGDFKWGCSGTFISNTFSDIGKGLENTQTIVNICGDTDCAAYICTIANINGINDWFLPSKDEIGLLEHAIDVMADFDNDSYGFWTSTQFDSDYARTSQGMAMKHYDREIWPIRRF